MWACSKHLTIPSGEIVQKLQAYEMFTAYFQKWQLKTNIKLSVIFKMQQLSAFPDQIIKITRPSWLNIRKKKQWKRCSIKKNNEDKERERGYCNLSGENTKTKSKHVQVSIVPADMTMFKLFWIWKNNIMQKWKTNHIYNNINYIISELKKL